MKSITTLVLVGLCAVSAFAQEQPAAGGSGSGEYLRRSQKIIERAVNEGAPEQPQAERENIETAERIAREAQKIPLSPVLPQAAMNRLPFLGTHAADAARPNELGARAPEKGVYLFVSDSMSDAALKDAFEVAAETKATVLFRGVRKGLSINKAFVRAHRIAQALAEYPTIQLDPRPFTHFDVQVVPTVVVSDGTEFVKVAGTLSVDYASRRLEAKQYGDAGSRGTTVEIVELDFLQDMADRIKNIDFEEKKRAALGRFWANMKLLTIPVAQETKVTYFDPTVVNQDEIADPNGNVIAPPGASFNPLDIVNFSKTVVVFDATDAKQMAFARKHAEIESAAGRGVILLTTTIDRERGWAAWAEYNEKTFPNRIFVLDELVSSRFGIAAVPSVIRAQGRVFRIEQIAHSSL